MTAAIFPCRYLSTTFLIWQVPHALVDSPRTDRSQTHHHLRHPRAIRRRGRYALDRRAGWPHARTRAPSAAAAWRLVARAAGRGVGPARAARAAARASALGLDEPCGGPHPLLTRVGPRAAPSLPEHLRDALVLPAPRDDRAATRRGEQLDGRRLRLEPGDAEAAAAMQVSRVEQPAEPLTRSAIFFFQHEHICTVY